MEMAMMKLPKHTEAVIFDLDGTLVDSMGMWKEIDVDFLGRFGYTVPENLQKEIEGMSFSETAAYFQNRFSLPMSLDKIKACWNEMAMEQYSNKIRLKPGAEDFLKSLKQKQIRTGIATSNSRELVEAVTGANGVRDLFDTVVVGLARSRRESLLLMSIYSRLRRFLFCRSTVWYWRIFRLGFWPESGRA